jgi:hypothetical protein
VLNPKQIAALGLATSTTQMQPRAVYDVHGTSWRIWLRPMLPSEHTCSDIAETASALHTTAIDLEVN